MRCPVCNGSGLSPGVMERLGISLKCGGCNGTGVREEDSGALASAEAFQRHYENLFPYEPPGTEDYARLHGAALDLAVLKLDRRYMAEIPNLIIGRTKPETVDRLEAVLDDYRKVVAVCDQGLMLERARQERKVADALRSLGQAHENLGENDAAETCFREARTRYEALGLTQEAGHCATSAAALSGRPDDNSVFESLHARLDAATEPLDVAELRLDLADLHFSRFDDFGAEEHLREADLLLEPYAARAGGAATADALFGFLQGGSGDLAETLRVRTLLARLYRGLARVRPDEDYHQRLLDLEGSIDQGSQSNADFSQRMRDLLDGL